MNQFDPDKFLSETSTATATATPESGSFDPDKFLADTAGAKGFNPDKFLAETKKTPTSMPTEPIILQPPGTLSPAEQQTQQELAAQGEPAISTVARDVGGVIGNMAQGTAGLFTKDIPKAAKSIFKESTQREIDPEYAAGILKGAGQTGVGLANMATTTGRAIASAPEFLGTMAGGGSYEDAKAKAAAAMKESEIPTPQALTPKTEQEATGAQAGSTVVNVGSMFAPIPLLKGKGAAAAEVAKFAEKEKIPAATPKQAFEDRNWSFKTGERLEPRRTLESVAQNMMKEDKSLTPEQAKRAADIGTKDRVSEIESLEHFNSWVDGIHNGTVNDDHVQHFHLHGDEMAHGMSFTDDLGRRHTLVVKSDLNDFGAFNDTPGLGHEYTNDLNRNIQNAISEYVKSDSRVASAKTPEEKIAAFNETINGFKSELNTLTVKIPTTGKDVPIGISMGVGETPADAEAAFLNGKEKLGQNSISVDNHVQQRYNIGDQKGEAYTQQYKDAGLTSEKLEARYAKLQKGNTDNLREQGDGGTGHGLQKDLEQHPPEPPVAEKTEAAQPPAQPQPEPGPSAPTGKAPELNVAETPPTVQPEGVLANDASLPRLKSTPEQPQQEPAKTGMAGESGAVDYSGVKDWLDKSKEQIKYSGDLVNDYYKLLGANEADKIGIREVLDKNNISLKDQEAIYHWVENPKEPITPEQEKAYHTIIEPLLTEANDIYSRLKASGAPVSKEGHVTRNAQDRGGWLDKLVSGTKDVLSGGPLRKTTSSMKHRVMMAATDDLGNRRVVSVKSGKVTAWDNKQPTELGNLNVKTNEQLLDKDVAPLLRKKGNLERELGTRTRREGKAQSLIQTRLDDIDTKIQAIYDKYNPAEAEEKTYTATGEERWKSTSQEDVLAKEVKPLENQKTYLEKKLEQYGGARGSLRHEHLNNELDKVSQQIDDVYNYYNPAELNDKVFTDNGGSQWKLGQATTKEIEQHSNVKYHKTILANELVNLHKLRMADRATQYLENLKNDPEFKKLSIKLGTQNLPPDYAPTNLPQLKGMAFPKRVSETLDTFYKNAQSGLMSPDNLYSKINSVMRNAIFFNPFMHIPNIAVHAAVNRGLVKLVIPSAYKDLVKTSRQAMEDVLTMNDNYKAQLRKGAGGFYAKQVNKDLYKVMLEKATKELEDKPPLAGAMAKALGYANPVTLIKGIYKFSGRATWFVQDFCERQAMYEEMLHGKSMEAAIQDVGKHIPNYRIPARIFNSTALAKLMKTENGVTMFGAYHYGALKSYGEMFKSIVGKVPLKERAEALDKLAAMAVIGFFVYPQLDKLAKAVTGNKNAKFRRAGAITFPYKTQQLVTGKIDFAGWVQSVMTPSVGLQTGIEALYGRDPRTGSKVSIPEIGLRSISPLGYGEKIERGQLTPARFAEGLVGISTPKVDIDKMSRTEKKAYDLAMSHIPMKERSKAQIAVSREKSDTAAQYKKTKDINVLNQAVKDKKITRADRTNIIKGETQTPLEHYASRLSYDEISSLAEHASPEEKQQLESVPSYYIKNKIKQIAELPAKDAGRTKIIDDVKQHILEEAKKVRAMPQGEEKAVAARTLKSYQTMLGKGLKGVFEDDMTKAKSKQFTIRNQDEGEPNEN